MNIVLFCGGRGAKSLINSLLLKKIKDLKLTCIVNTYDDGKSTGEIRRLFNMFGPSDLRKVQSALLEKKNFSYSNFKKLFDYRISQNINFQNILDHIESKSFFYNLKENKKTKIRFYIKKFIKIAKNKLNKNYSLKDWSLLNIIYVGVFFVENRNIINSIIKVNKLFEIKHNIYPNTKKNLYLSATRSNGIILYDEASIVEQRSNISIENIFLTIKPLFKYSKINKRLLYKQNIIAPVIKQTRDSINKADLIIYSPGTQYSSLCPTYMTKNIGNIISNNKKAIKIFVTNIGADYETPHFKASDYITNAYKYLNFDKNLFFRNLFDYNLINIPKGTSKNYVKLDKKILRELNCEVILSEYEDRDIGIHNGDKLVKDILKIIKNENLNNNFNLQ